MTVRPVRDLRTHVMHVSHGAVITMVVTQAALEDVGGGVRAGQWRLVAAQTRHLVQSCLYVRGLAYGAEPYLYEDGGAVDPCAGVPDHVRIEGLRFVHEANALATDPTGAEEWFGRLCDWVAVAQAELGLNGELPELRSPNGMFGGLRLVRGWQEAVDELGLPALLPSEWIKPL
ncbi:hypothetical protein [Streptomyces sp. NPDC055210]